MLVHDQAPVSPIGADPGAPSTDEGELRRCALCLSWRPVDETVQINPLIVWCTNCALRHPDLVPPPADVLWPIIGFLLGAFVGWLVALVQPAAQLIPGGNGLCLSIIGLAAGLGTWLLRAG